MRLGKVFLVCLAVLIVFQSFQPFVLADSSRVAIIKEISGSVYIKKGGGNREFEAVNGMSLAEGDSVRTEEDSSANLYYDDGSKATIGSAAKLVITKLSDEGGQKTGVKLWTGKLWNSVKNLLNVGDSYDVETPTAVMGVRGTLFLVRTDPETGKSIVTVLDGAVEVSTEDNPESDDGEGNSDEQSWTKRIVTVNETLEIEDKDAPLQEARIINTKQLVEEVEPAILTEVIRDVTETVKEAAKQAEQAKQKYQETGNKDDILKSIRQINIAKSLNQIQKSIINEVKQSPKSKQIDSLLKQKTNQTIEEVEETVNTTQETIEENEQDIVENAEDAEIPEEEIEEIKEETKSDETTPTNNTPTNPNRNNNDNDDNDYDPPVLQAPTASPGNGETVEVGTAITLTAPTGSTIFYTTEENPTAESWIAYNPEEKPTIDFNNSFIKVYAEKAGYQDSDIVTFQYEVVEAPSTDMGTISGTIHLPEGTATENTIVKVQAQANTYARYMEVCEEPPHVSQQVTIEQGTASVQYELQAPLGYSYLLNYEVLTDNTYVQQGYYKNDQESTASMYEASQVSLYEGSATEKHLYLFEGKEISGTISLPPGASALSEDINLHVLVDSGEGDIELQKMVTMNAGDISVPFSITVPPVGTYELGIYNEHPDYLSRIIYSGGPIDITDATADNNIQLELEKGVQISGTIALPTGFVAQEKLNVSIQAMEGRYEYISGDSVIIEPGNDQAAFTVTVPQNGAYRLGYNIHQFSTCGTPEIGLMSDSSIEQIDRTVETERLEIGDFPYEREGYYAESGTTTAFYLADKISVTTTPISLDEFLILKDPNDSIDIDPLYPEYGNESVPVTATLQMELYTEATTTEPTYTTNFEKIGLLNSRKEKVAGIQAVLEDTSDGNKVISITHPELIYNEEYELIIPENVVNTETATNNWGSISFKTEQPSVAVTSNIALDAKIYKINENATITIEDQASNSNPDQVDTVSAYVTSRYNPEGVDVELIETGIGTGVFSGEIYIVNEERTGTSGNTIKVWEYNDELEVGYITSDHVKISSNALVCAECYALAPGESAEFTFTNGGTLNYHYWSLAPNATYDFITYNSYGDLDRLVVGEDSSTYVSTGYAAKVTNTGTEPIIINGHDDINPLTDPVLEKIQVSAGSYRINNLTNNDQTLMTNAESYDYAVYNANGTVNSYGDVAYSETIVIPAGGYAIVTLTSSAEIIGATGDFEVTQSSEEALLKQTLNEGEDGVELTSSILNGVSFDINLAYGANYDYTIYDGNGKVYDFEKGSTQTDLHVPPGGKTIIKARTSNIEVVGPNAILNVSPITSEAVLFKTLQKNVGENVTSYKIDNIRQTQTGTAAQSDQLHVTGTFDYVVYNAIGDVTARVLNSSDATLSIDPGGYVVLTVVDQVVEVKAGFGVFLVAPSSTDAFTGRVTLEPLESKKLINSGVEPIEIFYDGVGDNERLYDFISYSESGNIEDGGIDRNAKLHIPASGSVVVTASVNNTVPITFAWLSDNITTSNWDNPVMNKVTLGQGESMEFSSTEATNIFTNASRDSSRYYDYISTSSGETGFAMDTMFKQLDLLQGEELIISVLDNNNPVTLGTPYGLVTSGVYDGVALERVRIDGGKTVTLVNNGPESEIYTEVLDSITYKIFTADGTLSSEGTSTNFKNQYVIPQGGKIELKAGQYLVDVGWKDSDPIQPQQQ